MLYLECIVFVLAVTLVGATLPKPKLIIPDGIQSVNGSRLDMNCSNGHCLFDGLVPSINTSHRNWASELVTLSFSEPNPNIHFGHVLLTFKFEQAVAVQTVSIDLFLCSQWGIGAPFFGLYADNKREYMPGVTDFITIYRPPSSNCGCLSRIVIPIISGEPSYPYWHIVIDKSISPETEWVHVGEVTFSDTPSSDIAVTTYTDCSFETPPEVPDTSPSSSDYLATSVVPTTTTTTTTNSNGTLSTSKSSFRFSPPTPTTTHPPPQVATSVHSDIPNSVSPTNPLHHLETVSLESHTSMPTLFVTSSRMVTLSSMAALEASSILSYPAVHSSTVATVYSSSSRPLTTSNPMTRLFPASFTSSDVPPSIVGMSSSLATDITFSTTTVFKPIATPILSESMPSLDLHTQLLTTSKLSVSTTSPEPAKTSNSQTLPTLTASLQNSNTIPTTTFSYRPSFTASLPSMVVQTNSVGSSLLQGSSESSLFTTMSLKGSHLVRTTLLYEVSRTITTMVSVESSLVSELVPTTSTFSRNFVSSNVFDSHFTTMPPSSNGVDVSTIGPTSEILPSTTLLSTATLTSNTAPSSQPDPTRISSINIDVSVPQSTLKTTSFPSSDLVPTISSSSPMSKESTPIFNSAQSTHFLTSELISTSQPIASPKESITIFTSSQSEPILIFTSAQSEPIPIFTSAQSESIPIFTSAQSESIPIFTSSQSESIPIFTSAQSESIPIFTSAQSTHVLTSELVSTKTLPSNDVPSSQSNDPATPTLLTINNGHMFTTDLPVPTATPTPHVEPDIHPEIEMEVIDAEVVAGLASDQGQKDGIPLFVIIIILILVGLISLSIVAFLLLGLYIKRREATRMKITRAKSRSQYELSVFNPLYVCPSIITEGVHQDSIRPSDFTDEHGLFIKSADTSTWLQLSPILLTHNIFPGASEMQLNVTDKDITEDRALASGSYGKIVLAHTKNLHLRNRRLCRVDDSKESIPMFVAVKKLNPEASQTQREAFEREVRFLSQVRHPNILSLLGVSHEDPIFAVMEYTEEGDLNQFLQKYSEIISTTSLTSNTQISISTLLYMASQISGAMQFLAALDFVHRDIATRKCIVGKDFHVKLADLGINTEAYQSHYYGIQGNLALPIRWIAMECFDGKFSEKSDVWAFGVTMWELFTLAKQLPYPDLSDEEVVHHGLQIENFQPLSKPKACPQSVYQIMQQCWIINLQQRATFHEVNEMFKTCV